MKGRCLSFARALRIAYSPTDSLTLGRQRLGAADRVGEPLVAAVDQHVAGLLMGVWGRLKANEGCFRISIHRIGPSTATTVPPPATPMCRPSNQTTNRSSINFKSKTKPNERASMYWARRSMVASTGLPAITRMTILRGVDSDLTNSSGYMCAMGHVGDDEGSVFVCVYTVVVNGFL